MNAGVFPLVVLAAVVITITVAWPEFWTTNDCELPFDAEDETRGDWQRIPHQGHPPDTG